MEQAEVTPICRPAPLPTWIAAETTSATGISPAVTVDVPPCYTAISLAVARLHGPSWISRSSRNWLTQRRVDPIGRPPWRPFAIP